MECDGGVTTYDDDAAAAAIDGDSAHQQAFACGDGWLRYWDQDEGANYYHNTDTGETRWTAPEGEEEGGQVGEGWGTVAGGHACGGSGAEDASAGAKGEGEKANVGKGRRAQNKAVWKELWGGKAYPSAAATPATSAGATEGGAGIAAAFAAAVDFTSSRPSHAYIDPELDAIPLPCKESWHVVEERARSGEGGQAAAPAAPGADAGQETYPYHDGYDWDTYARVYRS